MLTIDYIKIAGVLLSGYLIVTAKRQYLADWISIGWFRMNNADLMLGYFLSTLLCGELLWANPSTYAVWVVCAVGIGTISAYLQVTDSTPNVPILILDLLVVVEIIAVMYMELYWDWQLGIIFLGILGMLITILLLAGVKYLVYSRYRKNRITR